MKVVLDTNVLVSGLLNPHGTPGQIVRTVSSGALVVCYDARILAEYRGVLLREKFAFPELYVNALIDQIRADGILAASKPLASPLPDPQDEPFLEVALGAKADFLITGNLKDFPAKTRHGVSVVSPQDFIRHCV